jgi:hypothetical protein
MFVTNKQNIIIPEFIEINGNHVKVVSEFKLLGIIQALNSLEKNINHNKNFEKYGVLVNNSFPKKYGAVLFGTWYDNNLRESLYQISSLFEYTQNNYFHKYTHIQRSMPSLIR